jgi:hypothetical protein
VRFGFARYRLLDHPVTIAAPDPEGHEALRAILQGFPEHDEDGDAGYALTRAEEGWNVEVRGVRTITNAALSDAVIALEWQLVTDVLSASTGRFQLHGAALVTPSGRESVLVLGASGAGKTTLTLALMTRGFLPLADDLVVVAPETMMPALFPRAFHVDASTRTLIRALSADSPLRDDGLPSGYALPTRWASASAPIGALFFPTVQPGETSSADALSIPEAATALLPFSATLDESPELALSTTARLTARARCYRLRSGDLSAAAGEVVSLVN